jgi:hypothetical protein
VIFDADQAVSELVRLGLATAELVPAPAPSAAHASSSNVGGAAGGRTDVVTGSQQRSTSDAGSAAAASAGAAMLEESHISMGPGSAATLQLRYRVVDPQLAMQVVQQHWDGLLWQRAADILQDFQ